MQTRAARRTSAGVVAGVLILLALVAVHLLTPDAVGGGLPNAVRDFFTLSISVLVESLPFVFLGVLLSILVQVWVPASLFDRLLPRRPVLRRAAMSLLGVLLPVCECGNVPLARALIIRGLTVSESLTFLLAAPILNPVTIVTTLQAFGWDHGILVGRVVGGFLIANLVGWLFSRHPRQHELLTPRFEASCRAHHDHPLQGRRLRRSVTGFAEETSTMLPALVIGSAIAGAIQVGVPRDVLLALGSNPIWSVLALMALAFVIAICSNVDAFFILSFGSTFMPGGIVAFLTFGAMVDVKMLALLRTTFTTATLVRLTAIVGLACLILGFGVNLVG
ncbi:permease [Protaetiibacter larvae]|uniref:Permease n=1 Tax=Protaetiibacter larvae TaxID=2592654 RepID=A0A5C1Y6S3_9MICO|nr:permease [Protaetiibacter larvae]QEO08925.1 permease [Protaetiibacter larvae]